MGVSTDGILAFGVILEDGIRLPWYDEKHEGDIESWWRDVNGFVDVHQPWNENGGYAPGWTRDDHRLKDHFAAQRLWTKENPCPVDPVNYCSGDCPMWAIAVPSSVRSARRGYPETIDLDNLIVTDDDQQKLLDFIRKYDIECDDEPRWFLASYWG